MPINLFSRDTQFDVGNEPSDPGVPLWQSPDIVPRNAKVTDPLAGGLFDDLPSVDEIRQGQDNYVYTRIRSMQAMGSASNVKGNLWWSEPGTLAVPGSWQQIDTTINIVGPSGSTIQAGDFPRVAEFKWATASVPALGHYCLVSSIWSDDDPQESVTDVPVLGFQEWVRYKNNVAWRNVNVIAAAPVPPPPPSPPPSGGPPGGYHFFRMWANTPSGEEDVVMRLQLSTQLPRGTQVEMEGREDFLGRINPRRLNRALITRVHPELAAAFSRTRGMLRGSLGEFTRFEKTADELTHRIPLQFDRFLALSPTKFVAGKNEKIALNVWIPKAAMQTDIPITLSQHFGNQLLGGMTWKLARPAR
jgi:hypothetical protein